MRNRKWTPSGDTADDVYRICCHQCSGRIHAELWPAPNWSKGPPPSARPHPARLAEEPPRATSARRPLLRAAPLRRFFGLSRSLARLPAGQEQKVAARDGRKFNAPTLNGRQT